ncbi:tigger transposable element-derived protein 2-like [Parasteatoda tepidariorum]|uniref:tigger transposable element-derived protein 2-like n=1 Tax=Parasteatoda tepidariorum TaxID=114398 RepID=UPI001C71FC8A|nr:tigger transposable element-derived protein 2-like [Parasteatoda tepidariorum]
MSKLVAASSSKKRKRVSLSIKNKVEILKKLDEGSSVKLLSECYNVGLSTIYDIKNQKKDLLKFVSNCKQVDALNPRKTLHKAENKDVDKVLIEWIKQRRSEQFPLSRQVIMAQAKNFHRDLGLENSCEYSTGWFARFKQCHGLRLTKLCVERANADTEAAEHYVEAVLNLVQTLNITMDQIFNADETGLYYKFLPPTTYTLAGETNPSGLKVAEDRLTLLACANAAGTCKLRLTVIGKSKNPHCLKGVKVFPVCYKANKKAWVTQELFIEWFKSEFVQKSGAHCKSVGLPDDCKIVLFLDNCTAHPPAAVLNANNVEIEYLPPNCTSIIQPLDQGVLRSLKCRYKVDFLKKMIDSSNEGKSIQDFQKSFNVKEAIWLAAKAWSSVTRDTLVHAWRKLIPTSIFFEDDQEESPFEGFKFSNEKALQRELLEYSGEWSEKDIFTDSEIEECFNIDNDVPIVNELSDSEIVEMVLNPGADNDEVEESDEEDENQGAFISNERCIELTKELIKGMEQKLFVDESHIMSIYKIQQLFMQQKPSFRQQKMDEFFKK